MSACLSRRARRRRRAASRPSSRSSRRRARRRAVLGRPRRDAAARRVLHLPRARQPVEPARRLCRPRLGRPAGLCRLRRLHAFRLAILVGVHPLLAIPVAGLAWRGRRCPVARLIFRLGAPISPSAPGSWRRSSASASRRSRRWAAARARACPPRRARHGRRPRDARMVIYWAALVLRRRCSWRSSYACCARAAAWR